MNGRRGFSARVRACALVFSLALYAGALPASAQDARAELLPPDPEPDALFGLAVDLDGNTLLVGSPGATGDGVAEAGTAWVYVRDGGGWSVEQRLAAPVPQDSARFGASVHLTGDRLIVGAPGRTGSGVPGSAYVYRREPSGWRLDARIEAAADVKANGLFGNAVAIWGDTAVIGAPGTDSMAGQAYLYEREDGVWIRAADLGAVGGATNGRFGIDLDVEGSLAVVGAHRHNGSTPESGSVFVFRREGDGTWTRLHRISGPKQFQGHFGLRLDLDGDALIVAARGIDRSPTETDAGMVLIHRFRDGRFQEEQRLAPSNRGAFQLFGLDVAISGDVAIATSRRGVSAADRLRGDAFVFELRDGAWTETARLQAEDSNAQDLFAKSVALDDGTVVVGAQEADRAAPHAGAATVFADVGPRLTGLRITPDTLPAATAGTNVTIDFDVLGGTPPLAFEPIAGDVPVTGSIDAETGVLAGVTLLAGTYTFQVEASDGRGRTAAQPFTVQVLDRPVVDTEQLPVAVVDRPYRATLGGVTALGGLTWSVASGDLPAGLALDSASGRITGRPVAAGRSEVAFTATDERGGASDPRTVELLVEPVRDLSSRRLREELEVQAGGTITRVLELVAGTRLDVRLRGPGTDGLVLRLEDNDGAAVPLDDRLRRRRRSMAVRGLDVAETGRYFLHVSAPGEGFLGRLTIRTTPARRAADAGQVGGATVVETVFPALPGSRVTIVARPDRGSAAVPDIESVLDGKGRELLGLLDVRSRGRGVTTRFTVPLDDGGDLRVRFGAQGVTSGSIEWVIRVRAPRTYTFVLPDVVAGR